MHGLDVAGLPASLMLLLPFAILAAVMVWTARQPESQPLLKPDHAPGVGHGRYGTPLTAARAQVPVADATQEAIPGLFARIAEAEIDGDDEKVANLRLSIARKQSDLTLYDDAAKSLRVALGIAMRLGNVELQARARIELGDLARATGDLTTACEHWQIARALYHDRKHAQPLAETEARMRAHGCPTDWVLNDF